MKKYGIINSIFSLYWEGIMSTKNWTYIIIFIIIITILILLKLFATKTIFYGVFYFFLTLFFIYIFVKEKDLAKKFDVHRDKFVKKITEKYDIKNEKKVKYLKKTLYYIETIGTALILVVIIQRFYIGNFKIPTGSMIPTILLFLKNPLKIKCYTQKEQWDYQEKE